MQNEHLCEFCKVLRRSSIFSGTIQSSNYIEINHSGKTYGKAIDLEIGVLGAKVGFILFESGNQIEGFLAEAGIDRNNVQRLKGRKVSRFMDGLELLALQLK